MPDARTDRAWRRPRVLLAVAVVLLAAAVAVAWGAVDRLGIGSLRLVDPQPPVSAADAELYVALSGKTGVAPNDAAFRTSQDVVASQLRSDSAVGSVREERVGDRVILVAGFGDASSQEREEAARRIAEEIDAGALKASVGGEVPRMLAEKDELKDELWRKELLALPLALLVLLMGAGGIRRAAAPALCAALAVAGSLALLRAAGAFADVSLLGVATAAAVSLVLGVELPLRALRSAELPERDLRLAFGVALVAAIPGFALLATSLDQAASLALGAALAAALATAATRLVVPAIVQLAPGADPEPVAERRALRLRRLRRVAPIVGLLALVALVVPAVVYGTTAPYGTLDVDLPGLDPVRAGADSLFGDLPLAAAIAGGVTAVALAWLARSLLGLPLALLTLMPAGAALGVCALLAEDGDGIGRNDPGSTFFDTGAAAIAVCAVAAISFARSAMTANAFSVGRRTDLAPILASTAIGILAAAPLLAISIDEANELAVGLAAGLSADLVLLRLPLAALLGRWVGSRA